MTEEPTTDLGETVIVANEPTTRERVLADVFVALAESLVNGFDIVGLFDDLAGACVELLDVAAAGLMLVDPSNKLRVIATSDERSRVLELLEIQNDAGPCLDCYRTGEPVLVADLRIDDRRWPRFSAEATRVGFAAVSAIPMRLRDDTIGALNLFHREPRALTDAGVRMAQALADVATIGILQQRALQRSTDLADQLQSALNSRLIIEQAKGVLAEREQVEMGPAFEMLRKFARHTGRRLSGVAADVVAGELSSAELRSAANRPPRRH